MTSCDKTLFTQGANEPGKDDVSESVRNWVSEMSAYFGRPLTFFIKTFGCQQMTMTARSQPAFSLLGFHEGISAEKSDVVLFNTCSVRANADDRFYGHVGNMKPLKEGYPIIGVFGCMMEQDIHVNTIKTTFPYVDFILGAGAMTHIPKRLNPS